MSTELFDLSGRTALVTGSSQGIGFSIAGGLARAGARVILNGRDAARLEAAHASLAGEGLAVESRRFDVSDHAGVDAEIGAIESDIGPIDILVNNAGVQRRAAVVDVTPEDWQAVLDINLSAVFFMCQAVARRMIPRRAGKIVNICSLMSEVTRPTVSPYTAAKGAVKMLTRSLCVELAPHNIQANGIGPGYFATELNRPLIENPEFDGWLRGRTPSGRWGEVDELIGVAVFLSSAASSFVNGQVIYVDGGVLAGL